MPGDTQTLILELLKAGNETLARELGDLRGALGALTREVSKASMQLEALRDRLNKQDYDLSELRNITLACPARLNYREDTARIQTLEKGKVSKVTGAGHAFRPQEPPSIDWIKVAKIIGLAAGTATAAAAGTLWATK